MWLMTTFVAALAVTLLCFLFKREYKLGFLSLMLWGATIMILVDHVLGYEGGQFLEVETNGMIRSGTLLGVVMLVPVFLVWGLALFVSKLRGQLNR